MKKPLSLLLALFLFLSALPFASAETEIAEGALFVDGILIDSGRQRFNGLEYASLTAITQALGCDLTHDGKTFTFPWRKSEVSLTAKSSVLTYRDTEYKLLANAVLTSVGTDLLVPLKSFCDAVEIGYYYDEAYDTIYCTPGAGHWPIPENYAVPVLMYHGIGHAADDANLFVNPEDLEEQIVWFLDHGFTPIWFEDIEHIEDYAKPVILVFDDGWSGIYKYLHPLTQKYQVKAVAAVVRDITEHRTGKHVEPEQVVEMDEAGYIRFESHGATHENVAYVPLEQQEPELRDSELWLTRLVKKEPCAFIYPIGGSTPYIQDLVRKYYTFGAKMIVHLGEPYNTSDDPTYITRYFIERQTGMYTFTYWMNSAFQDPSLNNFAPIPVH